jgi:hypothetical protein
MEAIWKGWLLVVSTCRQVAVYGGAMVAIAKEVQDIAYVSYRRVRLTIAALRYFRTHRGRAHEPI